MLSKELRAIRERAVKSGLAFIDFWAVDFGFQNGGPFDHHWQDYRTLTLERHPGG